ncbi:MAG: pyrrolidone-carboxylate peptidase [Planctomycetota bacterium]|nr:MAG: pyrrolidone-carboxylate peptidase [Planctomycetota bacterium]
MSAVMRVLLTGFEPFEDDPQNPSAELVTRWRAAPPEIAGLELCFEVLPVDRKRLRGRMDELLEALRPQIWLGMGQHARSGLVEIECRAHNRLHYRGRLDNGGHGAENELIEERGEAVREATLPVPELAQVLRAEGLPVTHSDDAGTHLCNATLYHVLGQRYAPRASFVHLPLLPEQATRRDKQEESLALDEQERCVRGLLEKLALALRPTQSR